MCFATKPGAIIYVSKDHSYKQAAGNASPQKSSSRRHLSGKNIWHDKKSETPIDAYNHLIDPLRYGFEYLVPLSTLAIG